MKHKHGHKKAGGGSIAQTGPHEEATNAKKTEKMEHPNEYKGKGMAEKEVKVEKKKGGKIERKRGGKVPGHATTHRLDKKARGGAAKSPLSGADAPNMSYAHGNLKAGSEGQGKDSKAHI